MSPKLSNRSTIAILTATAVLSIAPASAPAGENIPTVSPTLLRIDSARMPYQTALQAQGGLDEAYGLQPISQRSLEASRSQRSFFRPYSETGPSRPYAGYGHDSYRRYGYGTYDRPGHYAYGTGYGAYRPYSGGYSFRPPSLFRRPHDWHYDRRYGFGYRYGGPGYRYGGPGYGFGWPY